MVAIIETESPSEWISSKVSRKIKMVPDVNYNVTYGTDGLISTQAIDAYSVLLLCFGKLILTAPAVFLEKKYLMNF